MNWKEKYLKEPVDGWSFPPDFLREMTHAINDESNESIEMEELEAVLLHLLKFDSSHPEQVLKHLFLDKETLEEIQQVLSFNETNVELAHRQQLIESLYRIYNLSLKEIQELCKLSSPPPEGQDEAIEEAARYLFQLHNSYTQIDTEIGQRLLDGFRKDVKEIAKSYLLIKK